MKIGIISDIHENFHNLFLALEEMEKQGIQRIFCLGDLMNPGVAKILAAQPIPTHLVWGNNDGEKVDITQTAARSQGQLTVSYSTYDFVKIDGKNIFLTHYFDLARPMAKSGEFDAVFYGHDHLKFIDHIGPCLVMNPGELAASKTGLCSYGWYDTSTGQADIVTLKKSITLKTPYSDDKLKAYLAGFSNRSQEAMGNHGKAEND